MSSVTREAPQGQDTLERPILVFFRDTERGLGIGFKTKGVWHDGRFDEAPWSEGEFRCDCARSRLIYPAAEIACGRERFVIERIVIWDTGETIYSEGAPA